MKATQWIEKNPKKIKSNADYERAFELLHIKSEPMKKKFRALGKAVVENDQETIDAVINYLGEGVSRKITAEEIDRLKFIAELAELGPEKMAQRQLYEYYYPKEPILNHIQKVPAHMFNWCDSQGVRRNKKIKYKKSSHDPKDRGLFGALV